LERGARRFPYPDTASRLAGALELGAAERAVFMAACRPTRTGSTVRYTLQIEPSTLVGRQGELAEISQLVAGSRVLTLTGAAGIGKTRLALELAHQVESEYADGALFIDLAAVFDAALVPDAVSATLGISAMAGESSTDSVRRHLQHLQVLLVLDNCEHVIGVCAQLVDVLIRTCPNVQLIVTSREPLRIHGETVWVVPPLRAEESVELFIQRAQAAAAATGLTSTHVDAIAEICGRLEGIPLAIELAAVRVPALGVPQVADLLADRLDFLSGGSRFESPRHQTLRAAIDWSYTLLDSSEQCLFARLSVFAGGWNLAAAREVCGWDSLTSAAVVDDLVGLVDKSLVVGEDPGAERRYRFLETIREYAVERLTAIGGDEQTRARHANYFRAVAEEGAVTRLGVRYPGDVARVSREHANMRNALHWLLDEGMLQQGLGLCQALSGFWLGQGFLREGEEWLAHFLARPDEVSSRALAEGLHAQGRLAEYAGALDRARELFERSLATGIAHDDATVSARALCGLGDVALHHGEVGEALDLFQKSLEASRAADSAQETAQALVSLGRAASLAGDIEQSRAWLERGLTIERRLADRWGVAGVLNELGQQARRAGQLEQAQALLEECHVLWRQTGTRMGERSAIMNLALVTLDRGLIVRSAELARDGLELSQDMADVGSATTVRCIEIAAQILVSLKSNATAVDLLAAATRRREELSAPRPDIERPEIDRVLQTARRALAPAAFEAAWNRGQALPISEAIELAAASLMKLVDTSSR
jgi:predicted ATPase